MRKVLAVLLAALAAVILLAYPITVVDDLGRVVTIDREPQRVVSVSPAATRYLIYLGLQDRVVGVTDWDVLKGVERIGNMVPLNVEKIVSLSPDLVLAFGGFQVGEVPKLEKVGLKVIVINPTSLDGIMRDLALVGAVFNCRDKAQEGVKELHDKLMKVALEAYKVPVDKRPKVLYLGAAPESNMKEFWTAASGSYMNDLISLAGGRNIAASLSGPNGWTPVSIEYIVKSDPDVIVVASFVPGSEKKIIETVRNFDPFKEISAVKNGRICVIDGNVASQPAPQLFDLLKELYGCFYEK